MALIDFHCHLDLYPDPQAVADEAARLGVYVLSVTTTPSAFRGTAKLSGGNPRIRTALGLHPELAVLREGELPLFEQLLPETPYVGEVGLDGSRPHRASLDHQGAILVHILDLCAKAGGKTITLHSRGATKLLLDVLGSEPRAGTPVLHWFTGTPREVKRAAEMGCWFSVGPAMMRSERGRNCVAAMPRDRILPETDGPFGQAGDEPLHPWEAMLVAHGLERLWDASAEEIKATLTSNFQSIAKLTANRVRAQQRPPRGDVELEVSALSREAWPS
jgi:TatD DNase family protein